MSKTRKGSSSTKKSKYAKVATKKRVGVGKRKTAKLGKVQCGGSGLVRRVYQRHKAKSAIEQSQKKKKAAKKRRDADLRLRTTQEENEIEDMKNRQQKEKEDISESIKEITERAGFVSGNSSKSFFEDEKKRLEDIQREMINRHKSQLSFYLESKEGKINREIKSREEDNKIFNTDYERSVKKTEVEKFKQRIEPKIKNIERSHSEIEKIIGHVESKKSIAGDGNLPTRVAEELYDHYKEVTDKMQKEFLKKINPASLRTVEEEMNAHGNPMRENQASRETSQETIPTATANPMSENNLAAVSPSGQGLEEHNTKVRNNLYGFGDVSKYFGLPSTRSSDEPVGVQKAQNAKPTTKFLVQTDPRGDKITPTPTPTTTGEPVLQGNHTKGLPHVTGY